MKTKNIIVRKNPLFDKCPSCGALNTLHRSRTRNWREVMMKSASFYKTYRCRQCGWRGHLPTITLTAASIKNLFIYLVLAFVVAFIVMRVLQRFS